MSLLARLRIPQGCTTHPPYPRAQTSAIRFASFRAPKPARQPNAAEAQASQEDHAFANTILDAVASRPQIEEDIPPPPPPGGYPKPNPAKPNPLRDSKPKEGEKQEDMRVVANPHLYRMYVKATRNNIIITFTRPNGDPLRTHTGGTCGFKHVNRSTHEAAHQATIRMFKTIQEGILPKEPKMQLHVLLSGFGKGRDAVKQAFLGTEGEVVRPLVVKITDKTPIKIGGNRAKKARRI